MADPTPAHIVVLYEDSRRGAVAIQQAAELATRADARLTVVVVAVTEPESRRARQVKRRVPDAVVVAALGSRLPAWPAPAT